MRIWMLAALAACSGDAVPDALGPASAATAVQVNLTVQGAPGPTPPMDVWVSRGMDARVAEWRARGGAVSLAAPPGTWEVWVASAFPGASAPGAADTAAAGLRCSGHATDVTIEPGATTVVTVAVRCERAGA